MEKTANLRGFNLENKPRNINVLFSQCGSQQHGSASHPQVTVKGLKKCCMSNAVGGTDDDMLWKMKTLTVKIETVTLIGKGR